MASEVDETQVQAVHCFSATFCHPATNDARSGILRVNSINQSIELFTIEGLVLSIDAPNIICFQFDVRNPETQFTIYRRSQIPVDIQTASSDDSDQICVLLDALIANRPIAPNCKFLRSGQADLCGRMVTLILLGNAHIVFAEGSTPILLINLAHTKISLSRKTGITLTLLKGPEQMYLLDMKSERERQEWVVAFNRAMAIRKSPPGGRLSVAQHRTAGSLASPGVMLQQRGSIAASSAANVFNINKKESIADHEKIIATNQDSYQGPRSTALPKALGPDKGGSFAKFDDEVWNRQRKSVTSRGLSFKRPSLNNDDQSETTNDKLNDPQSITRIVPRARSLKNNTNTSNIIASNSNNTTATSTTTSTTNTNNKNIFNNNKNNSDTSNISIKNSNDNSSIDNDAELGSNTKSNNMQIRKNNRSNTSNINSNNKNIKNSKKQVSTISNSDNSSIITTTTTSDTSNTSNNNINSNDNYNRSNNNDNINNANSNADDQSRSSSNGRRPTSKDMQKRESFSKLIDVELEPEPLRSPSFVAPISVQMKSIRSSYAAARSLVSATSMKRVSNAGPVSLSNEEAQDKSKNDDISTSKSLQLEEKELQKLSTMRAKAPSISMKPGRVPCIIVSIESNGTLHQLTSTANILQITARCAEAAAIAIDGAILQWSFSNDGSYTGPVVIPHPDSVQFDILSCGRDHHLAVSSPPSSQLYGWGRCSLLGMKGSVKTVTSMAPIPALADVSIKTVASAAKHTFAVSAQDEIWTWGGTGPWLGRDQSQHHFTPTVLATRLPTPVQQVACATESSYVVTMSGRVYACGSGRHGRLGLGDCVDRRELCEIMIPAEITDVVPGGRHALAQSRSGQIYSWGCNAYGQLGISASVKMSMSPVLVPALTSCAVVKIACAKTATLALTRSGDVLMCGSLTGTQVLDSPTILELDPTLCGRVHDIVCGYNIALIMSEPPSASSASL